MELYRFLIIACLSAFNILNSNSVLYCIFVLQVTAIVNIVNLFADWLWPTE